MSNLAKTVAPDAIHEEVRSYYGERARGVANGSGVCCTPVANSSCCSPASSNTSNSTSCCSDTDIEAFKLYDSQELAAVPEEAANVSLGCGNPTAIAALQSGEVVLDLGSGGGIDVFLAARQVGNSGYVYGLDMTDDMLELARNNAQKINVTNAEFIKGQIEDIPLPDGSVDVILSNCVINLSPDKEKTLSEAFRVLRPGGRLAISDIVIDGGLEDLPVNENQVRTALNWAGCIAGALTVDEYQSSLTHAGFAEVDVDIKHHYTLEALGQDMDQIELELPPEVIHKIVGRFAGSHISASKTVKSG